MLLLAEYQAPKAESMPGCKVKMIGNHLFSALKPTETGARSELGNH